MKFKSYADLAQDIKANAHKFQSGNFDLVVGIPRSGMIPAYMIALILNRPCTDLNSMIEDGLLQKGARPMEHPMERPSQARRILLVDDSILAGKALQRSLAKIPASLRPKVTTLAVYSSARAREDVDITLCYVPTPRVFEWNIFHHGVISEACVCIDGVLCVQPKTGPITDEKAYRQHLAHATPFILPSGQISTLITNRPEQCRAETEAWLQAHGIRYERLIMLGSRLADSFMPVDSALKEKAEFYRNSPHRLFIESDPGVAQQIARIAQKPVFCVRNNQMYRSGNRIQRIRNPAEISSYLKSFIPLIPKPAKALLKPVYRFLMKCMYLGARVAK